MLKRWTQIDAYDNEPMDCELYVNPYTWKGTLTMYRAESRYIDLEFYDQQDYDMFCEDIDDKEGIYGYESEGLPICWDSGVE